MSPNYELVMKKYLSCQFSLFVEGFTCKYEISMYATRLENIYVCLPIYTSKEVMNYKNERSANLDNQINNRTKSLKGVLNSLSTA